MVAFLICLNGAVAVTLALQAWQAATRRQAKWAAVLSFASLLNVACCVFNIYRLIFWEAA